MGRRNMHGPSCLYCYMNGRGRTNHKGHYGYVPERRQRAYGTKEDNMRRNSGPGSTSGGGADWADPDFSRMCPTLAEMLHDNTWDDGKERKTSTVLLFIEDGVWKLCLNDRDSGVTAWFSASTIRDLLAVAEERLASGGVEWRRPWGGGKKGR